MRHWKNYRPKNCEQLRYLRARCILKARSRRYSAVALGSGLAISNGRLSGKVKGAGNNTKHVVQGKLPGQCGDGKLLRYTEIGVFYLNRFNDLNELRKAIADYIDYYNNERISLKLKGLSPVEYRTQAQKAA